LDNCVDWRNGDRRKLVVISYPLVDLTPIGFNWCLVDSFSDFSAERLREKQFGDLAVDKICQRQIRRSHDGGNS
jgi:hypothetical protein